MPHVDQHTNELVIRIVYDGAGEAGKTTNIEQLRGMIALERMGEVESPGTAGPRTQYFDWLDFTGGFVDWRRVRCQIITVPGQPEFLHRRKHLLREADVIVYVVDSRESFIEETKSNFQATRAIVQSIDHADRLDFVVQANKQDLPDALPLDDLRNLLDLPTSVALIRGVANQGVGVMDTFILAMRKATERLRCLVQGEDTSQLGIRTTTAESLHAALRSIDEAEREALARIDPATCLHPEAPTSNVTVASPNATIVEAPIIPPLPSATDSPSPLPLDLEKSMPFEPILPLEAVKMRGDIVSLEAQKRSEIAKIAEITEAAKEARWAEFAKRLGAVKKADDNRTNSELLASQDSAPAEVSPPKTSSSAALTELKVTAPDTLKTQDEGPSAKAAISNAFHLRPKVITSTKAAPSTFATSSVSKVVALFETKKVGLRNECTAKLGASMQGDIDLSAGHVWPPVTGRALLANAILGRLSSPATIKSWALDFTIELCNTVGWTFHSNNSWKFDDETRAQSQLLALVRQHVDFQGIVPKSRVLFISPDEQSWRLWMLTGPIRRLPEGPADSAFSSSLASTLAPPLRDAARRFMQRFDAIPFKLRGGNNVLALEEQELVVLNLPERNDGDNDTEHFNDVRFLASLAA